MHCIALLCLTAASAALLAAPAGAAEAPVTLGIEAEEFQFPGDWSFQSGTPTPSGRGWLFSNLEGARIPAATAVQIPRAGRYHLWVRSRDFPQDRPGIRRFTVAVGEQRSTETFGDSNQAEWTWEPGGAFDLPAGPALLALHDVDHTCARADALLLTTDARFVPTQALGRPGHPRVAPLALELPAEADPLRAGPVRDAPGEPAARLENEFLRLEFLPATRDGKETLRPRVSLKSDGGWVDAGADPSAEAYTVVWGKDAELTYSGYFPTWKGAATKPFAIEAGGVTLQIASPTPEAVWNAGEVIRFHPRAAVAEGNRVRLEFHPAPQGTLSALWELRPGERWARVALTFTPAGEGDCSLGYHLAWRKPLEEVQELLLPMMWHRRRLPSRPDTLLHPFTPTPIALAQSAGPEGPRVWAVVGEPAEIPFAWPDRRDPRFGLMIRDLPGRVQPAIYGPVPGTERARAKAGTPVSFSFRVLVQPGDWYAGFRTAADEVFGLRDYRSNVGTSLTDAALNMIDLVMDDERGGWWEWARAPYQIESLNGSTHASPLTTLSLYRLTGDPEVYRRRALPTMEFLLSRSHAHFTPTPENTGRYTPGSMRGPVSLYGTTGFGGFWEMSQHRTPAFRDIALPAEGVRPTAGYSHAQPFEEWLARYLLTGDEKALEQAKTLADDYLEKHVRKAPTDEISPQPFFLLSFIPDWEGLLRMYEVTKEQRYLDGAVLGARQLMTGIWTQPVIPEGDMTVHPGGEYLEDVPDHFWWRGPEQYRLGYPRKPGDVREHRAPAWVPSNVGLGFEQPITYTSGKTGGRIIYQAAWAPNFLRLAAYTGDKTFETYARNAVLGRWANYPGYYVVGLTDLPLNPRYPYEGPDVSCIYYHHILPHLAWTIDYLVAEAELRSEGKIRFPFQRQHGYAWFDSRAYGHAPGTVYGEEGAWLWLRRGLVTLDNPAINYLAAHNGRRFFLVLMNESRGEERVTVRFSPETLRFDPKVVTQVRVLAGGAGSLPLAGGQTTVPVPGRGLVVLALDGVRPPNPPNPGGVVGPPNPPNSGGVVGPPGPPNPGGVAGSPGPPNSGGAGLRPPGPPNSGGAGAYPGYVAVKVEGGIEARAAAIQVEPGPWDAYVWCTAFGHEARRVTLHYTTGGAWQQREATRYPFEFSVPVADAAAAFRFRMEVETPDGKRLSTAEAVVGAVRE